MSNSKTLSPSILGCVAFFWWIVVLLLHRTNAQDYGLTIVIRQGVVQGGLMKATSGRDIYAFRGIPYATPPIGVLRFKPPLIHPGWGGTLDARDYRSRCPQFDARRRLTGNEDCLFLNIFTPSISGDAGRFPQATYPVMVFIHGGGYDSGSGNDYGPEKLVDKGVILVTMNYRLGVFGFLSTGDEECSGNWGLLDQLLAIRWVRENIASFGGDPNSITLFGQEAGAASISLHMVSPPSQGLFSRAILQSGSALCDWALTSNPYQYAEDIAHRVDCGRGGSSEIVDCLRNKPYEEILSSQQDLKTFGKYPLRAAPVVDRTGQSSFLPDDPINLFRAGNFRRIPLMLGVNRDEGGVFYSLLVRSYRENIRESPNYLRDTLLPTFLEATMQIQGNIDSVAEAVKFEYFSRVNPTNVTEVIRPFINMSTDALYVSCNDLMGRVYSSHMASTYMYTFEYRGENSFGLLPLMSERPLVDPGVSNGDELLYLFNMRVDGLRPQSRLDSLVSGRTTTLWTDFAKFGKAPQFINYEYPIWETFRAEKPVHYRIDRELRPETHYRERAVDFWQRHVPSLAAMVTPSTSPLVQSQQEGAVYRTLAWVMVAVAIALLVLVIVLLAILYNQKKSQSFKASTENQSRHSGSTLY